LKLALPISTKMTAKSGPIRLFTVKAAQAAGSAVGGVMGVVVRSVVGRRARRMERGAAGRADTFPIAVHANRDFRDIGNERVAEPHDVRRAGLLLLGSSLRGRRCGRETHHPDQA
jgi:hypothetical protein